MGQTQISILQEPSFYILLSLAQGDKHGYAILKEVAAISGGRVRLSTGTLYGALSRLLDQDLIIQLDEPQANLSEETLENPGQAHPGKPRRTYAITRSGRLALVEETNRLKAMLTAARMIPEEGL